MSPDLIGLMRGIRHPWMAELEPFIVFGGVGALIASLLAARWLGWRITACPYPLWRTAMIMLGPVTLLLGLVSPKLVVEPAAAVLLSAVALLAGNRFVKAGLLLLSPLWLLRMFFSEWYGMLFRLAGSGLPGMWWASAIADVVAILLLSFLLFPFFLTAVALTRESEGFRRLAAILRSSALLGGSGVLFLALGAYLMTVPAYDRLWSRDVRVTERYAVDRGEKTIEVKSSEYLTGMKLTRAGRDSVIGERTTKVMLSPMHFDTTWARLERSVESSADSELMHFGGGLRIECIRRPYTVRVSYAGAERKAPDIDSPWKSVDVGGATMIEWRSFPDSVLQVPVRFRAERGDSIVETIEVTFAGLADPLGVAHEVSYVIPRTTYVWTKVYR